MPMRKAKPAPDFSKVHQTWQTKLSKGKAMTKKPLTQIQPFELSNPASLSYKLKQKIDFDQASQDTFHEEKFESSPTAKEKILSSDFSSSRKTSDARRATLNSNMTRGSKLNSGRSVSLYVQADKFSKRLPSSSSKKEICLSRNSNKENISRLATNRPGIHAKKEQEPSLLVKSATGFEKIEVEFKPDPESLKSILADPDASQLNHCQAPFRRSTFTGKMRPSQWTRPMGGKRFSIYACETRALHSMSFKEYLENLKRESLASRERRASLYQNRARPLTQTTFQMPQNAPKSSVATITPTATDNGSVSKAVSLPKPNFPLSKPSHLVDFQGGTAPSGISRSQFLPKSTFHPSQTLFPSNGVTNITKRLASIKERQHQQQSLGDGNKGLPLQFKTTVPTVWKTTMTPKFPEISKFTTETPDKDGLQNTALHSAMKKPGSCHSGVKRNVIWSDVLASEQKNQHGEQMLAATDGKSSVQPHARKALLFNNQPPSKDKSVNEAPNVVEKAGPPPSIATPCRTNKDVVLTDIRTPITADEIRRRGIDPLSFGQKSPFIVPELLSASVSRDPSNNEEKIKPIQTMESQTIITPSHPVTLESASKSSTNSIEAKELFVSRQQVLNPPTRMHENSGRPVPTILTNTLSSYQVSSTLKKSPRQDHNKQKNTDSSTKPAKASTLYLSWGGGFSAEFLKEFYNVKKSVNKELLPERNATQSPTKQVVGFQNKEIVSSPSLDRFLSTLTIDSGQKTPVRHGQPEECHDNQCKTPEASFSSFIEEQNIQGCPYRVRRRARTPHAKHETKPGNECSQTTESMCKAATSPKSAEKKESKHEMSSLETKAEERVDTPSANCGFVSEPAATVRGSTQCAANTEENVPPKDCDSVRERKGPFQSTVWTKVLPRPLITENSMQSLSTGGTQNPLKGSPLLDLEVSLISQKIDARRNHNQFTPIRDTFSNPVLKEISNTSRM